MYLAREHESRKILQNSLLFQHQTAIFSTEVQFSASFPKAPLWHSGTEPKQRFFILPRDDVPPCTERADRSDENPALEGSSATTRNGNSGCVMSRAKQVGGFFVFCFF